MAEEYDPAFPTDEEVGSAVDDELSFEKKSLKSRKSEKRSKHRSTKKIMDNVLSDATVGSSSSSFPGTPSPPPPPPPPPPKQGLEQSIRVDDIPPPPPQPEMDLFGGLPPPKLEESKPPPPPPPPPPNKNGKHKVSLIEEPPPPPPPLPRRFDPYKNQPQTVSDELLLIPPPPPPPGDKPKQLPKSKVAYSPTPTACQPADSSFDSTNLAFLSSTPPPPPPQPTLAEENWAKSICSLLAPPPPPPPPPPQEEDNTAHISSSLTTDQDQSTETIHFDFESINNIPLPKEPDPLLLSSIPVPNTDCQKTMFVSHVDQELAKPGAVWKDSRLDKGSNKKSPRSSKWDIKPHFLQRIEEKQKLTVTNQLPINNNSENASTVESSEEKMFLELEREMVSRKLKADSSLHIESEVSTSTHKHKKKDNVPESKLLEEAKTNLEESKSKEAESKTNIESDTKKQTELKSPTKVKKKKKGLEFKPFVIKMQNTTERFSMRGPFQMKSALSGHEERESVVESSYHQPKHMTGKIPSMKLKAKQKADLLDAMKKDTKKEPKSTLDPKLEIKLEDNSLSKLDFKPVVKNPIKLETTVDVKESQIKVETKSSMWTSGKDTSNIGNKLELAKETLKTEAIVKPKLTFNREPSEESFYGKLIKQSETDNAKKKNTVGFVGDSLQSKLNDDVNTNEIDSKQSETDNAKNTNTFGFVCDSLKRTLNDLNKNDSKKSVANEFNMIDDKQISNIKIEPVETRIELVDTASKLTDTENKVEIKPVNSEVKPGIKAVKSEIKPVDTSSKLVDTGNKLVKSGIKPVDTGIDSNKCMMPNISDIVILPKTVSKLDKVKKTWYQETEPFPVVEEKQKHQKEPIKELKNNTKSENQFIPVVIQRKSDVNEFIKNSEDVEREALPQDVDSVSASGQRLITSDRTQILTLPETKDSKKVSEGRIKFSFQRTIGLKTKPFHENESQDIVKKALNLPRHKVFSEGTENLQKIPVANFLSRDTESREATSLTTEDCDDPVFSQRSRTLKVIPLFDSQASKEAERPTVLKTIPLLETLHTTKSQEPVSLAGQSLFYQGNRIETKTESKEVRHATSQGHGCRWFPERTNILEKTHLPEMQGKDSWMNKETKMADKYDVFSPERTQISTTIALPESQGISMETRRTTEMHDKLSPHIKEISLPECQDNMSSNVLTHERTLQTIPFAETQTIDTVISKEAVTERHNILSSQRIETISLSGISNKATAQMSPDESINNLETIPLSETRNNRRSTDNKNNIQIIPISFPNQQANIEVPIDRGSPSISSLSVRELVTCNSRDVQNIIRDDAGYHSTEVNEVKNLEPTAKYSDSILEVSASLQNFSGREKQLPDSNESGSVSESLPKVDTSLSNQNASIGSENILTVFDQISDSHSKLPGSKIVLNDDSSHMITSQDSIHSDNDDSNSAMNQTNSDITDTENTDFNFGKKGKRKRWHTDSESTQDETESRGRRRSTRIKSLEEVKIKGSPKSVLEQSNTNKNNSTDSSKEHSPEREITTDTITVEADTRPNVIFTQAYLQQKLKLAPQVTDIPSIVPQTCVIAAEPSQSSSSDSQSHPVPDQADSTHGAKQVPVVVTDENSDLTLTETTANSDNLDVKPNVDPKPNSTDNIEDLFEDESGEDKQEPILGPGLATTTSVTEEDAASRDSAGNSSTEPPEKRAREAPDYKAMGILKAHEIPEFDIVMENIYLTERKRSKASKEARRMLCECTTSSEDRRRGLRACDEDCLNKLLMIECSSRCPCGDYCTNKRFQRREYAPVGVFYSKDKGHGLKALRNIRGGTFIMEYCGEVLNFHEFQQRVKQYNKAKQHHFYFMALKTDEIIDATKRGNTSRFINHSCKPNCETQKWTVNGSLRVGFFTTRSLEVGEELTFDYQFEVYGEEAQKCYCGADNCRGFIGKRKAQPKGRDMTPRRRSTQERRKKEGFEDISLDEEIEAMCSDMQDDGLQKADHALRLSRLMVRAETSSQRLKLLQVLQDTKKQDCLKYFLTHHGLALIWSWMVDLGENREQLQIQILATLDILPIPHKNMLEDSKVRSVVNKWAQEAGLAAKSSEAEVEYSSASETPSRAATPSITTTTAQNTPVPAKEEDVPSDAKEENDVSTPVKENSDTDGVVVTPKNSKESGEPPKKKLLRQLQSEGMLPDPTLIVESETKENKEISGNKEEICESSSGETAKEESDIESVKNDENGKTENSTKEGSVVSAETETKSSIAKAAASLLEAWSTLKEIYIIPKLDKDKDRDRDRKDRDKYRDRGDRDRDRNREHDRYRERSRERERSRYDRDSDRYRDRDRRDRRRDYKKRSRSRSRERDDKKENECKTLPKLRKPWKDQLTEEPDRKRAKEISKQERRQAFEREMEEQIQKKEEEKKFKEEMMQQQMIDGYYDEDMPYHFVDSNGYPIPPHYSMDPNCPDMPPFPMPFLDHMEPGMLPPPGMGVPPDGMMPMDRNDPNAMMYVDENGMPMPFGEPPMHHGPPPGQEMMPPEQMPHGWDPNHGPPIFQPPALQEHMLPPSGIPEHMVPPGISEHMVPPGIPEHMVPPGIQEHIVPEHIQPAPWESNPSLQPGPGAQGARGGVLRRQAPGLTQQAPAQAQTTTFITPDGMLITQTITPLADPNVHQLQNQLINQNLTPVAVNAQASSTMQTIVEDVPSPPEPPPSKLPPSWKTATDSEGKVYYYHAITRQTQWDPPSWDGNDAIPGDDEAEMDLGTPTYDERKHRRTTTAAADTSSETAKKCKDHFRSKMSGYVVTVLNTYRKPECKIGKITNTEDFKHLARKLTHGIMAKELKHCKNMEDLEVNSNVKHKAKEYIRKYMGRYGSLYRKEPD